MSTIINGTSSAITFPDSSVQNTSAIVSGYVPYANLPAGSVLQVVNATYTTSTSTTSTSFVTTNLTASITPKFSTSKILVLTTLAGIYVTGTGKEGQFSLYRNGSAIALIGDLYVSGANPVCTQSYTYLDSPATTSSTTYAWYFKASASGTVEINSTATQVSSIILLEIAG